MGWDPTRPDGWWWQCTLNPQHGADFYNIPHGDQGLVRFFFRLAESDWNESWLRASCPECSAEMRITYDFPREKRIRLTVTRVVGLTRVPDYLPMMWETSGEGGEPWYDFKYVTPGRGGNWGLNKPAVLSAQDLREMFELYRRQTGHFPYA